jgi:PKD repeat protein
MAGCQKTPPSAAFKAEPTAGAAPLTVQFTDLSSPGSAAITARSWDFGDGAKKTSAEQNPVHVYSVAGTYSVTLTVTTSKGEDTELMQNFITVSPSGGGEGENEGEGEAGVEGEGEGEVGRIIGWVKDTRNVGIPAVEVTLRASAKNGGLKVHTDSAGLYIFEGVTPGEDIPLFFARKGYTANAVLVDVLANETSSGNAVLKLLADPITLPDAAVGGFVESPQSFDRITLPANALVDEAGLPVTGGVDVQITPISLDDAGDLAAFPGEFRAVQLNGDPTSLESFALADFLITQGGKPLNLAPGVKAAIELRLPADTPLKNGDTVALWYFDEDKGLWVEVGTGTVGPATGDAGKLAYFAQVPHLSAWNSDQPLSSKHCLTGLVVEADGTTPVVGAKVTASGLNYSGAGQATTNAQGRYCIDVKIGSQVELSVVFPGSDLVADSRTVNVPNVSTSCAIGGCLEMDTLTISDFDACISGLVTEQGAGGIPVPISGVEVWSSAGVKALTGDDGSYCMTVPGGASVSIFVPGRPSQRVQTVVDTNCGAQNCVVANVSVEFPGPGSPAGTILLTKDEYRTTTNAGFFASTQAIHAPTTGGVWTVTEQTGQGAESGMGFELLGVGVLDPGSPGTVVTPGGSFELIRKSESNPWAGIPELWGVFGMDWNSVTQFSDSVSPGSTLTYSWPGGVIIGPFSAPLAAPSGGISLLQPSIGDADTTVCADLTQGINLQWVASPGTGDYVQVRLQCFWVGTTGPRSKTMTADFTDNYGPVTISAAQLSAILPPADTNGNFSVALSRRVASGVAAPLTNGQGNVTINTVSEVTRTLNISPPPVAKAGPDQTGVIAGNSVQLDGSASVGNWLTGYQWTLQVPSGSTTAALSNPSVVAPSFVPDVSGTYTASLVVSTSTCSSAPDTVTIAVN